jgi:predicted chitinase
MTETTTSKVEKWAYPLKVGSAETTDSQQYYAALAKAKDGYYPLGANGLWHGGVHFDDSTGLVADSTEVRCIADGEVIAYRIDDTYPKSDYGSIQAIYSTGFVLIKHRLEVPISPAQAGPAPPGPSLTFYSLYMHLLDWTGYTVNPTLTRPSFWNGGSWQVKATANDKVLGLRVRQSYRGNTGYATVLSVLPRGTVVETGEECNGWLQVVSTTPADPNVPAGSGWVFKKEMTLGSMPNSYIIGTNAKDEMNPPQRGLAVHAAANQKSATTSILPVGTEVRIGNDGKPGKYQKLLEIVSGSPIPELTMSDGILGYIWEGLLESKKEPAAKGTVHVLQQPFQVKAGSVIGHVGKYQNHDEAAPKNLLHLEVFSCEDVKAFKERSKAKAASLPVAERTLVKIPKGLKLITHSQGIDATHPPKASDPGAIAGFDFLIPLGALESLPAEKKIKESVVMNGSTTTTYWWRLEGLLGDEQGNGINGWFAEPDPALSRHSPYEWPGVEFVEDSVSNVDYLAAKLRDLNQSTEAEKTAFVAEASISTNGPVKERLYRIINTDTNNRLTVTQIRAALAKPWLSQLMSQLVVKCESEWFYKAEKWDALDGLMGHIAEEQNSNWLAEKRRIERLSWWADLAGKGIISTSDKIWHMHFLPYVENANTMLQNNCSKCGININLTPAFMKKIAARSVAEDFLEEFCKAANMTFGAYKITTCSQVSFMLGQSKAETGQFTKFRESLNYSKATFTPESLFSLAPTAINNGFARKGLVFTREQKLKYIDDYLLGNDAGYGQHSFGDSAFPDNDYRGRGLLHLTFYGTYKKCADAIGVRIDATPALVETDIKVIIASGCWYWMVNDIGVIADDMSLEIDVKVRKVTRKINTGLDQLANRAYFTKQIIGLFNADFGGCAG